MRVCSPAKGKRTSRFSDHADLRVCSPERLSHKSGAPDFVCALHLVAPPALGQIRRVGTREVLRAAPVRSILARVCRCWSITTTPFVCATTSQESKLPYPLPRCRRFARLQARG